MGKFLNTSKTDTINALMKGIEHRLDNPFYIFNDKHPTICTFYNVNDTQTTLDEGSQQVYEIEGPQSSLRYNKISNVTLYGLERISTELDVGEYGLEANEIQGECILPPNSFKPYPDSYFTIDHVTKNNCWFRVTKVTMDTLENGNNFWKLDYVLDRVGSDFDIESRTEKYFTMLVDHVGSNFKSIVQDEEYKFIERLESVINTLSNYYHAMFFKEQLQTYTFKFKDGNFYNPEVIEFIRRNHILSSKDGYVYIDQAIAMPDTFSLQYGKSLYKMVEDCRAEFDEPTYYGITNEDPMSLLSTRLEEYYIVTPDSLGLLADPLPIYTPQLASAVIGDAIFTSKRNKFYDIIKNYFHGDGANLTDEHIDSLEALDYSDEMEIFHVLPIIIFILTKEITKLLTVSKEAKSLM